MVLPSPLVFRPEGGRRRRCQAHTHVSKSVVPQVEAYTARQKEHHRQQDFETEFLAFLRRHGIEFDETRMFQCASSALRAGKK